VHILFCDVGVILHEFGFRRAFRDAQADSRQTSRFCPANVNLMVLAERIIYIFLGIVLRNHPAWQSKPSRMKESFEQNAGGAFSSLTWARLMLPEAVVFGAGARGQRSILCSMFLVWLR